MFGVGQGPVHAVVLPDTRQPREGLTPVVSSAKRILIGSRGWTVRVRLVMIKVAAIRRYGAGRETAGSGTDLDRLGKPAGGIAAQFGGVKQPATVIGEKPGKQHLITTIGPNRLSDELPERLAGDEPGPVGKLGRRVSGAQQAGQRHHHADADLAGPSHRFGCLAKVAACHGIDRFPDRLPVGVDPLEAGAEQFTGVRVDLFDLQPLRDTSFGRRDLFSIRILQHLGVVIVIVVGRVVISVVIVIVVGGGAISVTVIVAGVIEAQPTKQQVGEQIGAALLFGPGIVRAKAAGPAASMPSMAAASAADTSPVT
jgi:hypothetical protein